MNNTKTLFYIILFCISLIIGHNILKVKAKNESFIPSLTLLAEEKPDVLKFTYTPSAETYDIKILLDKIHRSQKIKVSDNELTRNTEDLIITDAFTLFNNNLHKHFRFLSGTNSEKSAYFIRSLEVSRKGFNENDIVIGYTNDIDVHIINIIMNSFKENKPIYILKQITIDDNIDVIDKSIFTSANIDALFIYESLDSNHITKKLDKNMKIEIWDYVDNVNIHTMKVQMPFIKTKNIDFSLYFPQLKGKLDAVSSIFVVDIIIAVNENKTKTKNVNSELRTIITHYNKPDLINLYGQFFNVSDLASKYAKDRNDFYMRRDSMQILEQFTSKIKIDNFTYDISNNVNGFFDSALGKFYIYNDTIDEIPLKVNSKFYLSGQVRNDQNGLYKVTSVSKKQSILMKQDTNKKPIDEDIGYSCYSRHDITTKSACESLYDELGNKKKTKTYWDKPCEVHKDCPFYQANRNYQNYRGGCIDGRCEFPIGIKAVSYRLFDKNSRPVCHNCKDTINGPYCCDKQKYPDYAFELDSFERLYTNTL